MKKGKSTRGCGGFESMGLTPAIYRAVMKKGYRIPTPIQRKCVPVIMSGRDMVAMARTGSGKTAAFLIPVLEKLQSHAGVVGVRAVILSPTRELALQTSKYVRDLTKFTDLSHCLLLGGDSMEAQFEALSNNPDIVIATPGRLAHIAKSTGLSLKAVQFAVFDEADRLFEMGFAAQLRQILDLVPDTRQTLLFSATMPRMLVEFSQAGLSAPEIIRLDADCQVSPNLVSNVIAVRSDQKLGAFMFLMKNAISSDQRTLVFTCTRHHVEFVATLLLESQFECASIYGAMDASARKINLGKFRSGKARVLVVTDVAARGLDLPLLDNVVNLHFPSTPKIFVHRVGRVARAGRSGRAFSVVETAEMPYVLDMAVYLGINIPSSGNQTVEQPAANVPAPLLLGSMPEGAVDAQAEYCRRVIDHHTDLKSMERVCARAYKQYCKTRFGASPSSAVAAKQPQFALRTMPLHPMFSEPGTAAPADKECQEMLDGIRAFRAKGTVFEIGKQDQVMKEIRGRHHLLIVNHQKNAELAQITECHSNFRDEAHFITSGASDALISLEGGTRQRPATLNDLMVELDGDDQATMRNLKSIRRWDQTKKKFVRMGDAAAAGNQRNESGAKIDPNKKANDIYEKWCLKHKKCIPEAGSSEQQFGRESKKGLLNRAGGRFADDIDAALPLPPKATRSANSKRPRSELKAPEQINKERKKKAKVVSAVNKKRKSKVQRSTGKGK